jgi:hypothetical protein
LSVELIAFLTFSVAVGQVRTLQDPIASAQGKAAAQSVKQGAVGARLAFGALDPIGAVQILGAAEKTFPNLAADLDNAKLLQKAMEDPSMRGNLRGRVAEAEFLKRNEHEGWKRTAKQNAPQNDFWRKVNGKMKGAQIKVHANWKDYWPSMQKDNKAERFVVPDDHYSDVYADLEQRRIGALRGGLTEKAAHYSAEQKRLSKLGRTFAELDGAIESAASHYRQIATALRSAGKAASFVAIALGLLDGTIAVHEFASGKIQVQEFVHRVAKVGISGAASWATGQAAATAAIAAGASGAVPVAVAIVVGAATYLVVDWAIDATVDSLKTSQLSSTELALVWPKAARGTGDK